MDARAERGRSVVAHKSDKSRNVWLGDRGVGGAERETLRCHQSAAMAPQVIRVMRVETLEGAAASHDQQLLTLRRENDDLRKQLAEARSELHDLRTEGSLSTRSSGTRREVRWSGKERGDGRSILSPSSSSSPTTAAARRYSLAVESALAVGRQDFWPCFC